MSPIEKADVILRLLIEHDDLRPYASEINIMVKLYPTDEDVKKYPPPDLVKALEMLKDAGYIKPKIVSDELMYYTTFLGERFYNSGGYLGQLNRQSAENTRLRTIEAAQTAYQRNTVCLTVVLAFAAMIPSLYYLLEIRQHHSGFYARIFPLVVSSVVPAVLTIVLYKVLRKRR